MRWMTVVCPPERIKGSPGAWERIRGRQRTRVVCGLCDSRAHLPTLFSSGRCDLCRATVRPALQRSSGTRIECADRDELDAWGRQLILQPYVGSAVQRRSEAREIVCGGDSAALDTEAPVAGEVIDR